MSYLMIFVVGYVAGTMGITTIIAGVVFTTGITYSGVKLLSSKYKSTTPLVIKAEPEDP